jgi:hypothetical protein
MRNSEGAFKLGLQLYDKPFWLHPQTARNVLDRSSFASLMDSTRYFTADRVCAEVTLHGKHSGGKRSEYRPGTGYPDWGSS